MPVLVNGMRGNERCGLDTAQVFVFIYRYLQRVRHNIDQAMRCRGLGYSIIDYQKMWSS